MSFQVLQDRCIGCGACDFSCPTNALTKRHSLLGLFEIDLFTCDDCGICVGKCPERAIVSEAAWPVCHGLGCPLTSNRLAEVQCSIWQQRCPTCGTTMLSTNGSEFSCPKCDDGRKVSSSQIFTQRGKRAFGGRPGYGGCR